MTDISTDATATLPGLLAEVDAQRGCCMDATARMDPGEIIFAVIIFIFLNLFALPLRALLFLPRERKNPLSFVLVA